MALNPCFALSIVALSMLREVQALNNGFRLPAMGWSSWYGFTSNINEQLIKDIADGMVSSGLHAYGYNLVALDDGWAAPRDPTTHVITADPALFPSGMGMLSAYVSAKNLTFGIYTDRGNYTCLKRPGSLGYEALDAQTYAAWGVGFVKEDSCYGERPPEVDYGTMRDALNATGRQMAFCVCNPGFGNASFGNQWRTGPDLYSQAWDMMINRWGLATAQSSLTGPGGFPDPDNLEVGYSPRAPPGQGMNASEQRTMFTLWATLPAPLILSADLRQPLDAATQATLMNADVIAVNQDPLAAPSLAILGNASTPTSIWAKQLAPGGGSEAGVTSVAVTLLNAAVPSPVQLEVYFNQLGAVGSGCMVSSAGCNVTDLWAASSVVYAGVSSFTQTVGPHEAALVVVKSAT